MRFTILALFLICSGITSFSQKITLQVVMADKISLPQGDTIYYSKQRSLTWDDFKGTPVSASSAGAVTASGFAYTAGIIRSPEEIFIRIKIFTFFVKNESWKRPAILDDYHLLHEQRHFDITRIGAQDFYKRLINADLSPANFKMEIRDIFDKSYNESIMLQDRYDNETEHSIKRPQQLAWNNTIKNEMNLIAN